MADIITAVGLWIFLVALAVCLSAVAWHLYVSARRSRAEAKNLGEW